MSLFTYFENQAAITLALRNQLLPTWVLQSKEIEKRAVSEDIPLLVEELLSYLVTFAQEKPNIYTGWVGLFPRRAVSH